MENALRLLLVEDSPDDAELLLRHLKRAGYAIEHERVDTAEAFRAALGIGTWEVIVSDYSMPTFSAPDALAILGEVGLDLPFIIVSGSIGEAAAVEAMKAGAHDFFLKDKLARLPSAIERERREARVRRERHEAMKELRASQDRLRQAVRARDEFLSIASHELKTPLTSLSLQLESARQIVDGGGAIPNDKLKAKLASVSRQVGRLTALVNNLLEVTRITSGRTILAIDNVDLGEVVANVVAAHQEGLRRSGSELVLSQDGDLGVRGDRLGIESVVSNVLSNAIRYGGGKPIAVTLSSEGDRVRIVVADRGIGIAEAEQERIFDQFERAVPEAHFGGFGLGLWIARQILDAHRGTIVVKSAPGQGSVFTIELPREVPA